MAGPGGAGRRRVRVAFHAIDGVGLGHLVRAGCLAEEVRRLDPGGRVLILTNAVDVRLLERAGLDHVQLPARLAEPHADPWRSLAALTADLDDEVALGALEAFGPDLVVFDTHAPPAVVRGAVALGARTVLVLRELRPAAMRRWLGGSGPDAFDRLLIPHPPGEVDLSVTPLLVPIDVVGDIVRVRVARRAVAPAPGGENRRRGARRRTGALVLATAGGGGQPVDAERFLRAVADAHWLARARLPGLQTILVCGPYAPAIGALPGLTVLREAGDILDRMARCDLVVAQAGYNTVAEIRALRRPAVLVPGARRMEDQRARALRLARQGAAVIARPEARSIADHVERLLGPDRTELARMASAHDARPLVPRNREAARALLATVRSPGGPVRRAVIVAHDFPPRLGGMETVARETALGLARRGIAVTVYTTERLGAPVLPGVVVRSLYTPLPRPRRIDLMRDLLLTVEALQHDAPDVVHLSHAGLAPWVPVIGAAWPARVTVSVHGNDLLAPWVHPGCADDVYRDAIRAGLAAAHRVIPVSRYAAGLPCRIDARSGLVDALCAGADEPSGLVRIVPNGVDVARFSPGPADGALARRFGLDPERDWIVLTVARLAPRKGHATVVRALPQLVARHPRVRWAYTGTDDELGARLADLARELGVERHVVPLGAVDEADLPGLHRLARAFVLVPDAERDADVEGFGIALLEAAASGVPVVASRTGGVPEALGEAGGLLVPPGDPDATAGALARLLDDAPAARALGSAGRDRVAGAFTWDHTCARMLEAWRGPRAGRARGRRAALAERARLIARRWGPPPQPGVGPPSVRSPEEGPNGPLAAFGRPPAADVGDPSRTGARVARGRAPRAALRRRARRDVAAAREARQERRDSAARAAAGGRPVRIRAIGDGARLLPAAIADCEAAGIRPDLEVKLRRFLENDFRTHALPRAGRVWLHHGVPAIAAPRLAAAVASLPQCDVDRVESVRIHLAPEVAADPRAAAATVTEVHVLQRVLTQRGIAVMPPPELARYLSAAPPGPPRTAMIEPSNRCNLACPTCPTGTGKVLPRPDMTRDRFARVVQELTPGLANLALWNYGEPTLNRDLPDLIRAAKARGVGVVKVSSNVHFLDGERGTALLESGLDVLILSVDGASDATYRRFRRNGDFRRVEAAVRWLCAEKRRRGLAVPRIELQFIVMRHNEHELPRIRQLAAEWGVDRLRIKTFGAEDDVNRDLVPVSAALSRYAADGRSPARVHPFCTMAWDHAVINVDGSVTPCCYLRPDMGEAFVMGNVFESSFAEIWRGARYRSFRERMLADRAAMPVCGTCRGGTHDLLAAVEDVK
jgi:radical SAM protein with 4Fe4S-binding SPASM domain